MEVASPLEIFGRQVQFQQITKILACNGDLLIAGIPGSGRRTLVRRAAREINAKTIDIDCIRATNSQRFLQLFCEGASNAFQSETALSVIEKWLATQAGELFAPAIKGGIEPKPIALKQEQWLAFKLLIQLTQQVAESVDRKVVTIFHGFPHIRSWDRQNKWEKFLRDEIESKTAVSYALVATIGEISTIADKNLEIVKLYPLADRVVAAGVQDILRQEGLTFDPRSKALEIFLHAVQGHLKDTSSLLRRLSQLKLDRGIIGEAEVNQTIEEILSDLSTTFESLLGLLPANQAHLLESLALDPTTKPQSKEYINKHYLSRGGSLQGAIAGLQNKGLIYGPELGYKIALPLFALWLRQRLS